MLWVGFICVAIVASATCYDFFHESEMFEEPIDRFKRNAQKRIPQCCGTTFEGEPFLTLGPTKEECKIKKIGQDNNNNVKALKRTIEEFTCLMSCIAESNNMIQNGEINKDKVMKYIRSTDKDRHRLQSFEDNFDNCAVEAKETRKKMADKIKCDGTPISFVICMQRELLTQCPSDKWNLDQEEFCSKAEMMTSTILDQVVVL